MKYLLFFFTILMCVSCSNVSIYYIDANSGNDSNSGHYPEKAWATLNQVNATTFKPGDQILFKSGTEYFGQLKLNGSGSAQAPIHIGRYGEGKKPAIHGQGKELCAVLLHNVEFVEIRNLEITNLGDERMPQRRGVILSAENFGDCRHIVLDSLEIHHVNGSLVKSEGGGSAILWQNNGDSVKTRFVDLIIENCYLHHCERNGINSRGNIRRDKWHPSIGVIIRNNLLEEIPGDGIVPIGCDGAVVEHNIMRDCPDILSYEEAAAGIWPWSSDNTLIQFNEVSSHRAKWDGQGFDSDYNCQGTIIQYNYSHDNYGGFLLVCNNGDTFGTHGNIGTKNTTIRYNVSINDGIRPYETKREGWFSPVMHITGPVESTLIYNNLIIQDEKKAEKIARVLVKMDNWGSPWPADTWFANNIFVVAEPSSFVWGDDRNTVFTHNCFSGTINSLPVDTFSMLCRPEFINPDARGAGFEVLRNFMLTKESPLQKKGIFVSGQPHQDIFGKKPQDEKNPNIGIAN